MLYYYSLFTLDETGNVSIAVNVSIVNDGVTPTVTTAEAEDISANTALVIGSILDIGTSLAVEVGFEFGESTNYDESASEIGELEAPTENIELNNNAIFTVTVSNPENGNLNNINLSFILSDNLEFVSAEMINSMASKSAINLSENSILDCTADGNDSNTTTTTTILQVIDNGTDDTTSQNSNGCSLNPKTQPSTLPLNLIGIFLVILSCFRWHHDFNSISSSYKCKNFIQK